MTDTHKMVNVQHQLHGWTAECTCRRWTVRAKDQAGLTRKHNQHLKDVEEESR